MFVDPKKPKPVETGEKKDRIGVVMDSIIQVNNANMENGGDPAAFKKVIEQATKDGQKQIDDFVKETNEIIKLHTDKRGAVHGETKKSIGLYYKENWPMATEQQCKDGLDNTSYVSPAGLHVLVDGRLGVDASKYLRANVLPVASGGLLGDVCQWSYDWSAGVHVESARKTKNFFTDSPWTFRTPTGVMHFATMTGDRVLTNTNPAPGKPPMAITAWGGTQIRVYDKQVDLRRSRPQLLRGWSADEPRGRLLVSSAHMFDRNSVFFCEDSWVGVRSFNKNLLPFDILKNDLTKTNWDGIMESRETTGYNIQSDLEFTTYSDISTTKSFYLAFRFNLFSFLTEGMESEKGPGRPAEQIARVEKMFNKVTFNVPADGSIKIVKGAGGKPDYIVLPMSNYLTPPRFEMQKFYDSAWDVTRAERIMFAWTNRLGGEFVLRVGLGISNTNATQYWNMYMDFECKAVEDPVNGAVTITIKHRGLEKKDIQEFDEKFETKTNGYFAPHDYSMANDWAHPRAFEGSFEGAGGHLRTFTMYNRQYVGFYQHDLKSPMDWFYNPTPNGGLDSKYNYTQMSTINGDGFYGDHLRHIPLRVNGVDVVYLTRTRNYQHRYAWALAAVEKQDEALNYSRYGQYVGPWRESISWVDFDAGFVVPSFMIQNDPDVGMNVTNLVFNDQNNFTGKASFTLDRETDKNPVTFGADVKLAPAIHQYLDTIDNGWKRPVRQLFFMDGCLFYFTQTLDPAEKGTNFTFDGHIGVIKNAYVDGDTIKINGDIADNASHRDILVNLTSTMSVDQRTITGLDAYDSTDVYAIKTAADSEKTVYDVMVNLAPFNNFYFEFIYTKKADGTVTIEPSSLARDQVFPYGTGLGFGVDYDAVIGYGSHTPHRLHVNFQSPVMLTKAMWAFRKTPSSYGMFTKSDGFVKLPSGVMDNIDGLQLVALGGVVTIKGKNFVCREPISIRAPKATEEAFHVHDEIYCRAEGNGIVAYTVNNPGGYELEPHNGAAPLGFIDDGQFFHYDQHGYRHGLMPVVDGKRLSIYSYGATIPVFSGKRGSGEPINRYFLTTESTKLIWTGSKGKVIPIEGRDVKIFLEGTQVPYDGSGKYTLPAGNNGQNNLEIYGLTKITWAPGLSNLLRIGSDVVSLDFQKSETFNIGAELPRRFTVLSGLFQDSTAAQWPGLERWDMSNILDVSRMFSGCVNFNQNLSTWRTGMCKHFADMFYGCKSLAQVFDGWDVQKAVELSGMFQGTAIDAASGVQFWNVGMCQSFARMFKDTTRFNADISKWNVSCGLDFSEMFKNATAFNRPITEWNMRSAFTVESMFEGASIFNSSVYNIKMPNCVSLRAMFKNAVMFNNGIGRWGYAKGADLSEMFMGASKFANPVWYFDLTEVISVRDMFNGAPGSGSISGRSPTNEVIPWTFNKCTDFTRMCANSGAASNGFDVIMPSIPWTGEGMFMNENNGTMYSRLGNLDVSKCTNMKNMFKGATFWDETDAGKNLSKWDVSKVTDFSGMFAAPSGDPKHTMTMVENWNVSSARDMSGMFQGLRYANADLSKWDVSKVTNFTDMFNGCDRFNGDLSTWKTGAVISMKNMFQKALAFNGNINGWNTTNVTDMSNMFNGAAAFNQPIGSWNVAKVQTMESMFSGATLFAQDISQWKVTSIRNIAGMFNGAKSFNSNIGSWTIGKVTSLKETFYNAGAFNQDVSKWDTSLVTDMTRTFASCVVFNQDLSGWKVQRVTGRLMFDDNTPAWTRPKPNFA